MYTEMSDAQFNALCVEEEEAEAAGNGKGKRKRASKSTKKVGVQGLMHDLLDAVMNAVNDDGAKLCDPFMDAPDSTEYREMCAPDTEHLAFRLLTVRSCRPYIQGGGPLTL